MENKEAWLQVVREALTLATANSTRAVAAARFRNIVGTVASTRGMEYPPQGLETGRFFEFIESFPEELAFVRRVGGDIWVAPASMPNLLINPSPEGAQGQAGVRSDLFQAFTQPSTAGVAWYERATDSIRWLPIGTAPAQGELISIPIPNVEQAVADRRRFIATLEGDQKAALESALASPRGLTEFSAAVRRCSIQPAWHEFRVKLITDRIREWATAANLDWNSSWITTSSRGTDQQGEKPPAGPEGGREWRNQLSSLIHSIDEQDLHRISVPLDIVVKAMRRS